MTPEAGGLLLVIAVSLPYWGSSNLLEFPTRPETEAGLPLVFLAQGIVLTLVGVVTKAAVRYALLSCGVSDERRQVTEFMGAAELARRARMT